MQSRRHLQVPRAGRRLVEWDDHRPVMADRAVLKASTAQSDRLERGERYPDRREQVASLTADRAVEALEHVGQARDDHAAKLREAERMLGEGTTVPEAAKELGISEQTFHRWRNQYGGMKADDAKRLKELERENATLKRIVADKELEVVALKEISRGNW